MWLLSGCLSPSLSPTTAQVPATPVPVLDTAPPNTDLGRELLPQAPRPGLAWHACALANDGTVWCWGANGAGQLGRGSFGEPLLSKDELVSIYQNGRTLDGRDASLSAAVVPGLNAMTAIAVGAAHSCALDAKGALWCWGRNVEGQLGAQVHVPKLDRRGWQGDVPSPVRVALPTKAAEVYAGALSTCVIDQKRALYCLGDGSDGLEAVAQHVRFVWLDYGQRCWLQDGGLVTCDGTGLTGQWQHEGARSFVLWRGTVCSENGTDTVRCGEERTTLPGPVDGLSASQEERCALASGRVFCWGQGEVPLEVMSEVRALTGGRDRHCALDGGGSLRCWGRRSVGERSTPKRQWLPTFERPALQVVIRR